MKKRLWRGGYRGGWRFIGGYGIFTARTAGSTFSAAGFGHAIGWFVIDRRRDKFRRRISYVTWQRLFSVREVQRGGGIIVGFGHR